MNDSAGEGRRRREESLERRQMQEPERALRPKRGEVVQEEREEAKQRLQRRKRIGGWHSQRSINRWPQGGGGQSPLPPLTGATPSLRIGPEELAHQASGEGAPRATEEPP